MCFCHFNETAHINKTDRKQVKLSKIKENIMFRKKRIHVHENPIK